ncbi:hypothetical protein B0I35DRAFT_434052 [Stachybotrys elegans]|uniref:Uncharacterized protein n=1 Tax=Stachybotrys elegans TaxID=80388 RepID=A0A8K0WR47_9HYPO|nr:hypothetical protein B0I35DRAFT_434052 [Stachybotrys elegans]
MPASPPTMSATESITVNHTLCSVKNSEQQVHSTSSSQPIPKPAPFPTLKPEAGSILAIVQENSPRELYVSPLLWSEKHLELLQCRFLRRKIPSYEKVTVVPSKPQSSSAEHELEWLDSRTPLDWAARAAEHIPGCYVESTRTSLVTSILAVCSYKRADASSPTFRFDNGHYKTKLATSALYTLDSVPSLAYLDLSRLKSVRAAYRFRRRKRMKFLRNVVSDPETPPTDPFIVAVLIALAQGQQKAETRRTSGPGSNTPRLQGKGAPPAGQIEQQPPRILRYVHVLATPHGRTPSLYLYTAFIPPAFLSKFSQPRKASPHDTITIFSYRLSLGPPYHLPGKVQAVLNAERPTKKVL